jgi:PIN domain nuclease of toxin-antitoxin system
LRLLLDTHALLWWATLDASLSPLAKKALGDEDVDVFVSAATAWKISTKVRLRKLDWAATAGSVTAYVLTQGFRPLPVTLEHAERAGQLPFEHRDPFDRMLIAQAQADDLWLVSNEDAFDAMGVRRYW